MILQPKDLNLLQLTDVRFLFTVGMQTSVLWMNNKLLNQKVSQFTQISASRRQIFKVNYILNIQRICSLEIIIKMCMFYGQAHFGFCSDKKSAETCIFPMQY